MFDIYYFDRCVGTADVKKEGMYYIIFCICTLPHKGAFRIKVCDGEHERDLGICYPTKNAFALKTRIPIKHINGDCLHFALIPNSDTEFTVSTGEPFAHLDKLDTARLVTANGQVRIMIDATPNQQGSDRSP